MSDNLLRQLGVLPPIAVPHVNNHKTCPKTGKFIVTADNPFWCDEEGWIYPQHIANAGTGCNLIAAEVI